MIENLYEYFKERDDYCIIRLDENFPYFNKGDDIDIVVTSKYDFFNHVIKILDKYNLIKSNTKISINRPSPWKYYKHNDKYIILNN